MREYVISDRQLATIVLKFGGRMMNYSDGTYFVNYNEVDKYEPVEIHELIRCRDCSNYSGEDDEVYPKWCMALNVWEIEPDNYCSWGER